MVRFKVKGQRDEEDSDDENNMATTSAEGVNLESTESSESENEAVSCMTCNLAEKGNMIYCDFCEGWFHRECEQIDVGAYKAIERTNRICNILYRCHS